MHLNALNVFLAQATTRSTPGRRHNRLECSRFGQSHLMLLVLMVVMMYFMMIRPQSQQRKRLAQMLETLKSGDKVVTTSGIVGVVVSVKDKTISLRSADAKMEMTKSSVVEILERGGDIVRLLTGHEAKQQSLEISFRRIHHLLVVLSDVSADVARPGEGIRGARGKPGRHLLEHPGAGGRAAKGAERTASSPICATAIGTNDIQPYFKFINASNELDPTTFILNRLQRDASGKIKLGLDLQGGTSFLVEMDTNALTASVRNGDTNATVSQTDTAGALSQAVEVLRKRVDQFGVAEPIIQPEGAQPDFDPVARPVGGRQGKRGDEHPEGRVSGIPDGEGGQRSIRQEPAPAALQPIPPGYEVLKHIEPPPNGKPQTAEIVVVKKKAENGLSGDIVKSADGGARQPGRAAD